MDPNASPNRRALAATQIGLGGSQSAFVRPPPVPVGVHKGADKPRSHTPPLPGPLFSAPSTPGGPPGTLPAPFFGQAILSEPIERDRRDTRDARPGSRQRQESGDDDPVTRDTAQGRKGRGQRSPAPPTAAENDSADVFLAEASISARDARGHGDNTRDVRDALGHGDNSGNGSWSANVSKPQRASVLRKSAVGTPAGRYSVQHLSAEYVPPPGADMSGLHGAGDSHDSHEVSHVNHVNHVNDVNDVNDENGARARRFTPKQRPAHRRGRTSDPNRITGPGRGKDARQDAQGPSAEQRPAIHTTVQGRPPMVPGSASPGARTFAGQAASASTYEPLPRDKAGFEAFMRQRAESGVPGARLNWKEQETLVVQRSALPALLGQKPSLSDRMQMRPSVAIAALLLIGVATFWFRRQATVTNSMRALPIDSPTNNSQMVETPALHTVIATEPSGAELLLAGAVLGNTPIEIARPEQGEETYLLRMRGFESQLVRITPQTGEAMRVTLLPLGGEASAPPTATEPQLPAPPLPLR